MHLKTWKTALSAAALLLLIAALPAAAQDWVGRGRANGRVTDQNNKPIAGAKVTLHLPGRPDAGPTPLTTDKHGRWSYLGLTGGTWAVVIQAEGYKDSTGTFEVDEFNPSKPVDVQLEKNPFDLVQQGQDLIDKGNFDEARAKFEAALPDMDPHQKAQVQALIGTTYYQQKNFEQARAAYEKALPGLEAKEKTGVQLRLGDSYAQQGQFDKARQVYEQTLQALPPDSQSQVLLAVARSYDQEGNRDKAVETVKRILDTSPDNVQALQLIADLLSRQGKEEEAQEYLDKIPDTAELPPDMLLNQGIRFYNESTKGGDQKKLDQAMDNFQRVIKQNPDMADAYYYRGLVYLNQGKDALAKADFQKLLKLDPDSQYAKDAKDFLKYLESPSQ
jgi:tetratricopeptide (TPR) repeat protein